MKIKFSELNVQAFAVLLVLLRDAQSSNTIEGTYQKFALANETRLRSVCPPALFPLPPQRQVQQTVLCYSFCIRENTCTIFSVSDDVCSVWSFQTDQSYEAVTFPEPTVVAYWPKRTAPVTAVDVAMGKPVMTAGFATGHSPAAMLTGGTTCYSTAGDCFCSPNTDNWLVVDLQQSLPVRKVVITGPPASDAFYYTDISVRAGNTGGAADQKIFQTQSATPPGYKQYTIAIASGDIRYIRMQYEPASGAICLCKLQAFL
ncbi:uncharacterized protein LOC125177807 [Hyalella azteca]|uniref:Uncharacterized protein LOC125177807 n=1 Tax=Hyalella azteca TaxID=294128 RepID=A0A979FHY7_HYAAZ|nr:uncharacterized protein LOC125177807 [Hyalella azteca]